MRVSSQFSPLTTHTYILNTHTHATCCALSLSLHLDSGHWSLPMLSHAALITILHRPSYCSLDSSAQDFSFIFHQCCTYSRWIWLNLYYGIGLKWVFQTVYFAFRSRWPGLNLTCPDVKKKKENIKRQLEKQCVFCRMSYFICIKFLCVGHRCRSQWLGLFWLVSKCFLFVLIFLMSSSKTLLCKVDVT